MYSTESGQCQLATINVIIPGDGKFRVKSKFDISCDVKL